MKRWLGIAVVLCVMAATPVVAQVAQQTSNPAPQARASAPLAGPRLTTEFPRAQPAFADSAASTSAVASDTHTIRMSTLVLVLVVVILVLLIAK